MHTDLPVWQILAALAPNFGSVLVARFLGGICSAGGSVTLGMGMSSLQQSKRLTVTDMLVADMWEANEQQFAVAFVVFSSVFVSGHHLWTRYETRTDAQGSVIGPLVGPFIEANLTWYVFLPSHPSHHPLACPCLIH
jgi:hypothetical protein